MVLTVLLKPAMAFLKKQFELILQDAVKQEAVSANLFYEQRTARTNKIKKKLTQIIRSI